MKNIFRFHILFYFVAFICFFTGQFNYFIMFTFIIIVHEIGHLVGGLLMGWKIEEIIILPFGGITIFSECLNKSILSEFIIVLLGPLFQLILLFIFYENQAFRSINIGLLMFNLLPIVPLDGAKIMKLFLNLMFSYYYSSYLICFISLAFLCFCLYKLDLVYILIFIFIFKEIVREFRMVKYYFNKFLLERYLYKYILKKGKVIRNIYGIKRGCSHLFYIDGLYYEEQAYLKKIYKS